MTVDAALAARGSTIEWALEAAEAPDKAGLTRAGRALQKHSDRSDSVFSGLSTGTPETRNYLGRRVLQSLADDPGTRVVRLNSVTDFRSPSGAGFRVRNDGFFMGMLEPDAAEFEPEAAFPRSHFDAITDPAAGGE